MKVRKVIPMKNDKSSTFMFNGGDNDECYTPREGVEPLLKYLEPFRDKIIWCPFDKEESEFVKCFQENNFKVVYSHIDNGQDFYNYEPKKWDLIVSNPPFTNKRQIFERAISFNKPFCLLMTLAWLNDTAPKELWATKDLQLLMFDKRMKFKFQGCSPTFSSAYYCVDFLPKQIIMDKLGYIDRQLKLF